MALSTTKVEYIPATKSIKERLWLKDFQQSCNGGSDYVTIFFDELSALHLMKYPTFNEIFKHLNIKSHFIHDVIAFKKVMVKKIATEENPTNALTGTEVFPTTKFDLSMNYLVQVRDPNKEMLSGERSRG